ncbi:MAG: hypothetical protein JNJ83_19960 [Verrucomicrobiaceae bacterium]|nr:hypothetical protein [Verrucomicrobiaceae bacterium]
MKSCSSAQSLPSSWTRPRTSARLHIRRAHGTPKAVIIRRKPSKLVHVIAWDTDTDNLEHGSWFKGRIYSERCDLSWDGRWMVYLAMGSGVKTWNGICNPPWLSTVTEVPNDGTWAGGGYFSGPETLCANTVWHFDRSLGEFSGSKELPFLIERLQSGGEVFPILSWRLERDGWQREGDFGKQKRITLKHSVFSTLCEDDPGWSWQPTSEHPVLRMYYRGYFVHGYTFEFRLEGSDLLDPEVEWATWDSKGDLLVARQGSIQRFTLIGLASGAPQFSFDLDTLSAPGTSSVNDASNDL